MSAVLGIVNPKGGVRKTTLATNLARAFQLEGEEVILLDTDPQRSATEWAQRQSADYGLSVRHVEEAPTALSIQERTRWLTEGAERVVIDGAAKLEENVREVVRASDRALIPVQPTPMDRWGTRRAVEEVRRAGTSATLVISRQIVGTRLAEKIAKKLESYNLPVLEPRTSQRVAYAEAMAEGKAVLDLPGAEKAKEEIRGIAAAVKRCWEQR